jgi:hypothetical protein
MPTMNRTSKNHTDKKRKRRSTGTGFVRNLKIVDNFPESGELIFDTEEFVRLFRDELIKKYFKKASAKGSK